MIQAKRNIWFRIRSQHYLEWWNSDLNTDRENIMVPILKLDDHDEEKEIEFELSWLLSLTLQERFQLMFRKTKELIELLERNGHRRPDQITRRS